MSARRLVRYAAFVAVLSRTDAASALDIPDPKAGLRIEFAVQDGGGKQIASNRVEVIESAPGRIVWHVQRDESVTPRGRNVYANAFLPIENDTGSLKSRWSYPGDFRERLARLSADAIVTVPYRVAVDARAPGGQPWSYKGAGEFRLQIRSRERLAVAGRTYDIVIVSIETVPAAGPADRIQPAQEFYWLAPELGWYLRRENKTNGLLIEAVRVDL